MRDLIIVLLGVSLAAAPTIAQEREHSPFGCEGGAVDILVDGHPRLRFEPLDHRPVLYTAHEFTFESSPFGLVRISFTATLPEEEVGRETSAQLTVYAETASSVEEATARKSRWWKLAGRLREDQSFDTSHGLWFEARQIATCFGGQNPQEKCGFADVSLATEDKNLPLIVIGFTQNLGGANARNWTDARLLLDFRASPPRVAVTADCTYNEGGGACTAIDSSQSARSTLECRWAAEPGDFLCTETTSEGHGAHRDFYLFANQLAPARKFEVASLEEAADVLARKGKGQTVTVHKFGPVTFIDEIRMDGRGSAMLLSAGGDFYLAPRSRGTIGPIMGVVPHGILDPASPPEPAGVPEGRWTGDYAPTFTSRLIVRHRDLSVLQVTEAGADPDVPSQLYWIGIQPGAHGYGFDAMRLVAHGRYANCGKAIVPPVVVSIGEISRPFSANVRVQPTTADNIFEEGEPEWYDESEEEQVDGCIKNAIVSWKNGALVTTLDSKPCTRVDKPSRVRVQPDGGLRIEPPSKGKD